MKKDVPTFDEFLNEDIFKRFIKKHVTPRLKKKLKNFKKKIRNFDKKQNPFNVSTFIDDMISSDKELAGMIQQEFQVENPTQWIMQQMEMDDEDDIRKFNI